MAVSNTPPAANPVRSLPPPPTMKAPGAALPGKPLVRSSANIGSFPFWIGMMFSIVWVVGVFLIIARSGPLHTFGGLPLVEWAIGISAIASPVAMIWMVCAYVQRAADIKSVADPLRRQLGMVTGESGAAEARIRRFNQAIKEQIELLKSTQSMSHGDLTATVDRMRQHREDLERFEHTSVDQVREIQEIIRRNMQQVENMMDDKFTMLRVLDGKMIQNGETVTRQTEAVRDQLLSLLQELDTHSQQVTEALDRAMRDSKKLADTARAQETSLTTAAETAAETLSNLSGKIDLSAARFLERASSAREEAERLASSLDTQTRSLEEFSNTLPGRVSEAESVIRGVADRLYSSEQLAREQAVSLSEKLAAQVDGLEKFMERFTGRLTDIDGSLEKRRFDLDALAERMAGSATGFVDNWEKSITGLQGRTNETLARFTTLNAETRKDVESVAEHLAETTRTYEGVAVRTHKLSEESGAHMKTLTSEITAHLKQFEALNGASKKAGEELQSRADGAMQSLQHVLDRLMSAREATQTVGETLVKDLFAAANQNEQLIGRLNETAQMSVRALGIATESLGKQEGELAERTRAAEAMLKEAAFQLQQQAQSTETSLREQAQNLMTLLGETQERMNATGQQMQTFAARTVPPIQDALRQIDTCADQNLQSIGRYGEGLQEQVSRLQQFHARVSGMGEDLTRITGDTLASIDQLNGRFIAVRTVQEETARKTIDQFTDLSDRLQKEVAGLDSQTAQAVTLLQQAAAKVSEQSYQLLHDAENSGAKMQIVTGALQGEATQIRSILQKQADDLSADLTRAEKQFAMLGDALKQRTDAAYGLLDRVAAHYNETTRAAAQELDARTQRLEQVTSQAQSKAETLSTTLEQQLSLLGNGTSQFEAQATQVSTMGGKALQQLSALNEKFSVTYETASNNARQALTRLEECNTAFMRQGNSLAEAAQTSVTLIQKAGSSFGEQAGKMLDTSQQVDQNVRQLSATTATLADQTAQVRAAMEQQNQRLVAQLTEALAQIELAGGKFDQTVTAAMWGADQASARFSDMTQSASSRLGATQQDMQAVADKAESALSTLGTSITQQAASLSIIGEQLNEQYRTMSAANENQRAQLIDLFDQLGAAHGEASEVADRTIARLTEALNQIQRHLGSLSDQSQTTVGNVRTASTGFADQSAILLQNAQQAEQQARTVLSVTAALQEQAKQLREALHGESERAGDALSTLIGKLSAGGVELREMSSSTEMSLNSLHNTVSQQSQTLTAAMQQIGDRQRTLTISLDAQRDVLNGLLNRLNMAQDETAAVAERTAIRLTEGAQQIAQQAESIGNQAQNALANVQTGASVFTEESGKLAQNAQQTELQVRSMLSVTATLQDQARQLRETLHGESERTADILDGLMGKLTSGGEQLCAMGSSTETSLDSLNQNVNQQIQSLTNAMQQIGERQRTLTTALDAQRDVLNGLLSRLNIAQDETASVAERTTARLTDGAQQIARQAEIIGSQAQSALASVQAAGAGFADEAGTLTLQAQQAEQQMRGILSVTAGMQDQARQLRESMQTESARVIEQLNGVITQLDGASNQLKTQSGGAVHAMDQAALQFTAVVQSSSEAMNDQAAILSQTADLAEGRMAQAGEKIRNHLKLVGDIGDQTEVQTRQLADAAEYAANRLVTLRSTIVDSDKDGQTTLAQSSARIAEVKVALQSELQRLTELSQQAVQQVMTASDSLAAESDALRVNLAMSESALAQAAIMVREESGHLPAVLERNASHIETAIEGLKAQTESADKTMVSTADRFISVTTTARQSLIEEMQRIGATAEEADQILRQFNKTMTEQASFMRENVSLIAGEQQQLVEKANESVAHLSAASDRLADLRKDAAQSAERLAREFDALDKHTASTGERLVQAGDTMAKNMEVLAQTSERAESQMLGASSQFREQFERIRAGLQGQIDDINRGLMQITAQLERTSTTLRSTTAGTVADVERVAQRFDQTSKTASEQLTEKTGRMRGATEEVAKMLSGFGDQLDVLLDRLAMAGDGIRRQEGDLVGQLDRALTHLGSVVERLEAGRALAANVSDQATARLGEVVDVIEKEMQSLTSGSQTAAGIMRGIGQVYSEQTQTMSQGVREAHSQVMTMNKAIDDMQQRTDRMRVSLKVQGEDLMNSLSQILKQLNDTGETIDEVSQTTATVGGAKRVN
jgi:hypothetical protein